MLLWTRRRLVKQRHTKALETAGRGPFSTLCRAANTHHLLQPHWITTLTTFHTYKSTLSHSGNTDICLLLVTMDFLMLSFFQVITQRSHTPLGSVWGLLFWGAFDLFTRKTLHRHYLIQPSLSRERHFWAVRFACELSFLLFFFFLLDWLAKEAQSSPQILSGVRNRGGITLNYCTF